MASGALLFRRRSKAPDVGQRFRTILPRRKETHGLNSEKMARLIRPFGVGPRRFWFGPKESGNQKHGYCLAELEEALRRNPSPLTRA
jgi:hypothetical protein